MDGRSDIVPLLVFNDVWQRCCTKPFDFVRVMQHNSLGELESLRVFNAMRASALENRDIHEGKLDDPVDKFDIPLVH